MTTVDPAFLEAGQSPGLEIWRIEKLKVIRQDAETLGDFYSGDSYIILQTSRSGRSDKLEWDIHFWLGKTTSQDEAGVAAYKTVELDDWLGGGPVQYREVQEHESRKFLAYFKNGIRYLDGGVESGFKKVQRDVYEKRLFQIKGKRNVRIKQVELTYKSLNQGDVFILDDGLMIYVWNGPRSSKTERIKGLEIARRIKDEERGGKAKLHIIDDRFDRDLKFFKALGDKGEISSAEEGGDDVAFEQSARQEVRLFRVTDASGSLEMEEIAERPFTREHLDSNDCFILDSGTSGIWVWVGKNCTTNEKKSAMSNAIEFLSVRGYPKYTGVTRVAEKGEPPLFKQFFPVWRAPEDQIGMGQVKSTSSIAQYSNEKFDTSVLHTQTQKRQQGVIPDDGSGHIQLWRVENNDLTPLSQETHGLFYSGDCYVILYTFLTGGREKFIIYFWQGSRSSVDERGASAILAERMDKQMGGVAVQVRVVQNQEPEHFLRIFSGRMVTLMGGINNEVEETGVKMYHVRGTNEVNTRAAQVPASASSLNSNDVFMVVTDYDTFLWIGKGSSQEEAKTASGMTRVLSPNARPVVVQEGDEPSDFWEALGGRAEYVTAKRLENTRAYVPPRLFQASNASGRFHVEEIVDFSQEDLCEDDVFLLDVFDEIYVWIGKGANEIEKKESLHTAKEYVLTDPSGRSLDDTVLLQVKQGYEPPSFTAYFLGWDPDMWKQMKSYEQMKEEVSEEGRGVTLVDEVS